MRDDLDLDVHGILAQLCDSDGGPQGLMVRHPLLEVAHHGAHGLVVERQVVRVDAEDLRPALSARVPQVEVHVGKGLVDLFVEVLGDGAHGSFGLPAAWRGVGGWLAFWDLSGRLRLRMGERIEMGRGAMWEL